jgi:hypothetical protein
LRIGWNWFKGIFHHGWHLFPTIALQGQLDPDPAFASKKQLQNQLQRRANASNFQKEDIQRV